MKEWWEFGKKGLQFLGDFAPSGSIKEELCQCNAGKQVRQIVLLKGLGGQADQGGGKQAKSPVIPGDLRPPADTEPQDPADIAVHGRQEVGRPVHGINEGGKPAKPCICGSLWPGQGSGKEQIDTKGAEVCQLHSGKYPEEVPVP